MKKTGELKDISFEGQEKVKLTDKEKQESL